MVLTILGWLFIITGISFLFKPERLRDGLKKKSIQELKSLFFVLDLVLGILLIIGTWGMTGTLANILMLLGVIKIGKAIFILKAKAADSMVQWLLDKPVKFFRSYAVAQIIFGAIILSV